MAVALPLPRRLLVTAVIIMAGGLIALWAVTRLPHATITITPATREQTITQTIILSAAATEPDFRRLILPARVLDETVTLKQTVRREGGEATPAAARGVVTLHNEQDAEQPLLPKTHLRHAQTGTLFLTDRAVRLPVQGSLDVPVTAKQEGAAGNVVAGKFIIEKLPASLQPFVYGENSATFSGGEVYDTPITEEELKTTKERVEAEAKDKVNVALSTAAGGAQLRDELTSVTTEQWTVSVEPGSLASRYNVTLELRARAFIADENDLLSLTLLALRDGPNGEEELSEYDPSSFTVDFSRADFEWGEAQVTTSLTGTVSRKTEASLFDTRNLSGRSAGEVAEYFGQFDSVAEVRTELSPFWIATVPTRSDAIEIVVKQQQE